MRPLFLRVAPLAVATTIFFGAAVASERIFTYTYQSGVLARGQREIEVWNTLHLQRDNFYRKFLHRIEYEIGLGSNVQTAFYLNVQNVAAFEPGSQASIEKELEIGFSNEWKLKFSDPLANAIGSAAYFEYGVFPDELELEGKIILDKQIGRTTQALNIGAEPEWADKVKGNGTTREFELALEVDYGFSYQLGEDWFLGLEVRSHNEYADGRKWEHSALFAGPVFSYRTTGWWITLTALPQVYAFKTEPGNIKKHLELRAHEQLETRLLFSYEF